MTRVLGRRDETGASGRLGRYLSRDGSAGAPVAVDLEHPHAALVVGKRGSGKSYTLGVLAEELSEVQGVTAVVVDPMGVFDGLAADDGRVVADPTVAPSAVPPAAWPDLLGVDAVGPVGGALWRAAADADSLDGIADAVAGMQMAAASRRAVGNHLELARSWGVFDAAGLTADDLLAGGPVVLDLSGLDSAPMNAVVRAVAGTLYRAATAGTVAALPWLLVDEAHAFLDADDAAAVADPALRRLLTRGRAPGVSVILATQRPRALPEVAVSQADLLIAHRVTSQRDLDALATARPTYLAGTLAERLPDAPGEALIVDDATETAHVVQVRERHTPHGGASPRASHVDRGE